MFNFQGLSQSLPSSGEDRQRYDQFVSCILNKDNSGAYHYSEKTYEKMFTKYEGPFNRTHGQLFEELFYWLHKAKVEQSERQVLQQVFVEMFEVLLNDVDPDHSLNLSVRDTHDAKGKNLTCDAVIVLEKDNQTLDIAPLEFKNATAFGQKTSTHSSSVGTDTSHEYTIEKDKGPDVLGQAMRYCFLFEVNTASRNIFFDSPLDVPSTIMSCLVVSPRRLSLVEGKGKAQFVICSSYPPSKTTSLPVQLTKDIVEALNLLKSKVAVEECWEQACQVAEEIQSELQKKVKESATEGEKKTRRKELKKASKAVEKAKEDRDTQIEEKKKCYRERIKSILQQWLSHLKKCTREQSGQQFEEVSEEEFQIDPDPKLTPPSGLASQSQTLKGKEGGEPVQVEHLLNRWYTSCLLPQVQQLTKEAVKPLLVGSDGILREESNNYRLPGIFLGLGSFGHVHTIQMEERDFALKIGWKGEYVEREWNVLSLIPAFRTQVDRLVFPSLVEFKAGDSFPKENGKFPHALRLPLGMPWGTAPTQVVEGDGLRVWMEIYWKMRYIHGPHTNGDHTVSVVHRDVRPQNVVFWESKQSEIVKLDELDNLFDLVDVELRESFKKAMKNLRFNVTISRFGIGEKVNYKGGCQPESLDLIDFSCAAVEGIPKSYSGSPQHRLTRIEEQYESYTPRCLDDIEVFLATMLDKAIFLENMEPAARKAAQTVLDLVLVRQKDYDKDLREKILAEADHNVLKMFVFFYKKLSES